MKQTDDYIFRQPENYRAILLHLIVIVERIVPNVDLRFKYGIPYFYYKQKAFCYLASNPKKGYIDLGFARGFQLNNYQEVLVDENRNTVKSLRYFSLETINNSILEAVLQETMTLYK